MLARGNSENVERVVDKGSKFCPRVSTLRAAMRLTSLARFTMPGLLLSAGVSFAALSACSPEPVTVDLQFQGLNYFVIASTGEIRAYRRKEKTRCAELLMLARDGVLTEDSDAETGVMPLCEMRHGGAHLSLDAGDYDLIGIAHDDHDFVVVVGCEPAHVEDGGRVEILMAGLSDQGEEALAKLKTPCANLAAACSGRCR
jgi:hypothetical protein